MPAHHDPRADLRRARQAVVLENARAARAAAVAARNERQAAGQCSPARRALHERMARLYRQIEKRHRVAARLHAQYAVRVRNWLQRPGVESLQSVFMGAVADELAVRHAVVTIVGRGGLEGLVAASDSTARSAHDLEYVLGEGPGADVVAHREPLSAAGVQLTERWPQLGPALAEIGVGAVVAVPLGVAGASLGSLCAFDGKPELRGGAVETATQVGDALTQTLLDTKDEPDGGPLELFGDGDDLPVIYQAAGMVSVHGNCGVDAAMALIKARAFAENLPVPQIAKQIVQRQLRLP